MVFRVDRISNAHVRADGRTFVLVFWRDSFVVNGKLIYNHPNDKSQYPDGVAPPEPVAAGIASATKIETIPWWGETAEQPGTAPKAPVVTTVATAVPVSTATVSASAANVEAAEDSVATAATTSSATEPAPDHYVVPEVLETHYLRTHLLQREIDPAILDGEYALKADDRVYRFSWPPSFQPLTNLCLLPGQDVQLFGKMIHEASRVHAVPNINAYREA
jgi:hypothetical protein